MTRIKLLLALGGVAAIIGAGLWSGLYIGDLRTDLATAEGRVTTLTEQRDRATASANQWRTVAETCRASVEDMRRTAQDRTAELVSLTAERDRLRIANRETRRATAQTLEAERSERYAAMTRAEACEAAWLDLYTLLENHNEQP